MNNKLFTKELIKISFAAMVCDNEIHEKELAKIKKIEKEEFYFKKYDFSEYLEELHNEFKEKGLEFKDTIVTLLIDNSGSTRGKPITIAALCADILSRTLERCLDWALGIIKEDRFIDDLEIEFIEKLILNLMIPKDIVYNRFGNWYLPAGGVKKQNN